MPNETPKSEYYEAQYNARAAVPEHPRIIARWAEQSAQIRTTTQCQLDLEYGPGALEKLDLFLPQAKPRALLVFIHGGYWRSLDKSDFSFLTTPFLQHDIAVALPNYALCPQTTIDHIVQQMRTAIAWLWRNGSRFGVDPVKLFVSGHSAGGHLAAMMAATHWPSVSTTLPLDLLEGCVSISGLYDLGPLLQCSMNADLRMDAAAAGRLSAAYMIPPSKVPMILAVGGAESDEFKRQNRLLLENWGTYCPIQEVPLPGFNHFTVIEQLAEPTSPLHGTVRHMMRYTS